MITEVKAYPEPPLTTSTLLMYPEESLVTLKIAPVPPAGSVPAVTLE